MVIGQLLFTWPKESVTVIVNVPEVVGVPG